MHALQILSMAALLSLLSGCATFKGTLENRLTTTLQGDRAFVSSLWGPIGFTSELSPEDAAEIQRLRQLQQRLQFLQIIVEPAAPAASTPGTKL